MTLDPGGCKSSFFSLILLKIESVPARSHPVVFRQPRVCEMGHEAKRDTLC